MTNKKELAKLLIEEHPGVPHDNIDIATELVEASFAAMKRHLLKEGSLVMDGIGRLEIRRFSGSEKKKDPRTGIEFKVAPRNVLKFMVAPTLKGVLNLDRKPRQKVD